MKVVYSIGSKFGGHGIGAQAMQAVRGIYRARALKKVLVSYSGKTPIPPRFISQMGPMGLIGKVLRRLAYWDPTGWGYVVHDNAFDRWASSEVEKCDIFHGWNHHCLRSLLKAKELGATAVVERASSHILRGQEILREEYRKYGVRGSFWPKPYVEKCLKEYKNADFVVVPSDYARNSFLERGFDERRIVKIPFGVDHGKFKSQISNLKSTSQMSKLDKFIVLYVGEVRLGKGVQYLLEAWRKSNLKDAELWLVGEVKREMRQAMRDKRQETVRFLGFRRDVVELMERASVFAFPSLDEGSALVIYEAMAAGLPVVTTPNAGSLVRDSLDGYIIPTHNSDALAERLEFFYKYPGQAKMMGKSGRERISAFTWERYGESLVKVYIKMLTGVA